MTRAAPWDADLAGLLLALRESGFALSVADEVRLARVFAHAPRIRGRQGLRSILRAALAKTADDRERFDRVFNSFMDRAERLPLPGQREPADRPNDRGRKSASTDDTADGLDDREPAPSRTRVLVALAAFAVIIVGLSLMFSECAASSMPMDAGINDAGPIDARPLDAGIDADVPPPDAAIDARPSACSPDALRDDDFAAAQPVLTVVSTPPSPPSILGPLLLSLAGLMVTGVLWWALRRRHALLPAEPLPEHATPMRTYLPPPPARIALIDARAREGMVWGIQRFVSDQSTRRLDIATTVRDTAKHAGIPQIHFERARLLRRMWLWIDTEADDPAVMRLADEIQTSLIENGLPVRRATFRGRLDTLRDATDGHLFTPREIEHERHGATVAILTDGAYFDEMYTHRHSRRMDATLRGLAHWPQLAVVDFSIDANAAPSTLARVARAHDLTVIAPMALADYLGTGDSGPAHRASRDHAHAITQWAAVCALCPGPVHRDIAQELRAALALPASPWALAALTQDAGGADPGGHLSWTWDRRLSLLAWLRDSCLVAADDGSAETSTEPHASTLLERAVAFWLARYEAKREQPGRDDDHQLRLDHALMTLWRAPASAARELHALYQGRFKDTIERHLGALAPADAVRPDAVRMLWRSADAPDAYIMLRVMGFDAKAPRSHVRRPGRLWMGVALCASAALALSISAMARPAPDVPDCQAPIVDRADAWATVNTLDDGRCDVRVMTPHTETGKIVEPGTAFALGWLQMSLDCVETLDDGELWRCGAATQGPANRAENDRRVMVVDPGNAIEDPWRVEDLALALIECQRADAVYIGTAENWARERARVYPLDERAPEQIMATEVVTRLRALHDQQCGSGVQLVDIPSGVFTMGTREVDQDPHVFSNEKPARRVRIGDPSRPDDPAFSMARCEVSNRQYRAFFESEQRLDENAQRAAPDEWGQNRYDRPGQPVVGVDWNDANAFCEHFGLRLPTEAEWEYACRGLDPDKQANRLWSFPGGETELSRYAWGEAMSSTQTIGTKAPAGYKLHDMHGNAWEWVADWYKDSYPAPSSTPDANPVGPANGSHRVLRGGAFGDSVWNLRCADRNGNRPSVRIRFTGFRCVRGSGRQP